MKLTVPISPRPRPGAGPHRRTRWDLVLLLAVGLLPADALWSTMIYGRVQRCPECGHALRQVEGLQYCGECRQYLDPAEGGRQVVAAEDRAAAAAAPGVGGVPGNWEGPLCGPSGPPDVPAGQGAAMRMVQRGQATAGARTQR